MLCYYWLVKTIAAAFTPAHDYFESLVEKIPNAKKRVIINAMTIMWGPRTEQLVPLLIAAVQRGAEVRIVGDIYSKFYAMTPRPNRTPVPSWKHIEGVIEQLQSAGASVTYIGRPLGLNPFKRRCHTKIIIIDDFVYSFGGINFGDDSFLNHDYMLGMHDAKLADRLYAMVREIESDRKSPMEDAREQLSEADEMLFDGGTLKKSVIYETACDVVAEAKKVYYVSQMCPSGKLAELITATDNECYFIRPSQADPPAQFDLAWDALRYRVNNLYKGKTYIHAKFILTEGRDGSRHLISGSNNFSWRGIKYGTKEIALHSTDPELWQTFYTFLRTEVANEDKN